MRAALRTLGIYLAREENCLSLTWGTEKQTCHHVESAQASKPASMQVESETLTSAAELATQSVRAQSQSRSRSG